MIKENDKKQEKIEENIELSYHEKIVGQLECLRKINKILKNIIEDNEHEVR